MYLGGRKCNFAGCDRPDLQPAIENGWYWASTGELVQGVPSNTGLNSGAYSGGLPLDQ